MLWEIPHVFNVFPYALGSFFITRVINLFLEPKRARRVGLRAISNRIECFKSDTFLHLELYVVLRMPSGKGWTIWSLISDRFEELERRKD